MLVGLCVFWGEEAIRLCRIEFITFTKNSLGFSESFTG